MKALQERLGVVLGAILLVSSMASGQGLGASGDLMRLSNGSSIFRVRSVFPGQMGSRLGLQPGDSVLSINGVPPGNAATNQNAILIGGGSVRIEISRFGVRQFLGSGGNVVSPQWPLQPIQPGWPPQSGTPNFPSPGVGGTPPSNGVPGKLPNLVEGQPGPDLQVDFRDVNSTLSPSRLEVFDVTPNGLGSQLGLRKGDIVVGINGTPVSSLFQAKPLYVVRNGRIRLDVIQRGVERSLIIDRSSIGQALTGGSIVSGSLGITTYCFKPNVVTVRRVNPGIGREVGLEYGMTIFSINGRPMRSVDDVKAIDQSIADGQVSQLVFEVQHPGKSNNRQRLTFRPR